MLPKKNRLDTKTVEKVFKMGAFLGSPIFNFRFIKAKSLNTPQIAFFAPKSLTKSAVLRNRLRRQGYLELGKYLKEIPKGLTGIFIFKKKPLTLKDIENETKDILDKIN